MAQLHKRFSPDQLKELFERYLQNEIERKYIQEILGIKKSRFFMLLKANLWGHSQGNPFPLDIQGDPALSFFQAIKFFFRK
jgi:hypothetical protein